MKRIRIGCVAICILGLATVALTDPPKETPEPDPLQQFMKQKLTFSQSALEGVVVEDYRKIVKNGQALSLLSLESGWQVLQTDEYVEQSAAFRKAVNRMTEAGREKNLDRAALAYVDMTMRCVECHRYVRSAGSDTRKHK